MVQKRSLPKAFNPLLQPEHTPQQILVERRRLGQTNLAVKPGQVGTSNATKPENLGMFDYAHLRAPLPKDLKGSEVFAPANNSPHPESYFLMRRSSDGYVSATGMFKASFPWARHQEEEAERKYIKSLSTTSNDEVAGNVWIPPWHALELAEEYRIVPWVKALLDPELIDKGATDPKKSISPPPKFVMDDMTNLPPPNPTPSRGRGRPRSERSDSPSKNAAPNRKTASPRKSRGTKATNAANASAASASLQAALDSAASAAETEPVNGVGDGPHFTAGPHKTDIANRLDPHLGGGNALDQAARVEIDSAVDTDGEYETTHTNVRFDLSGGASELPLPESTEEMIAQAKEMVEEAKKMGNKGPNSVRTLKRKAEQLEQDDDDDDDDLEVQPAKKVKIYEEELKKEKVRTKALLGLTITLAFGSVLSLMIE
ncbi:MAG: hypothetical protein M1827_002330 [Pycnora praestabilis]|nr:MAG: hypothetical protein M1827_002330 [Pycnora praestabilis]